jgi:hypothetical protein
MISPIATHHHLIYFIMCQLSLLLKVFLAHFQWPWFFLPSNLAFFHVDKALFWQSAFGAIFKKKTPCLDPFVFLC